MRLQFDLFLLLLILLVIVIYYNGLIKLTKKNSVFRGILIVTYMGQLFYLASYIASILGYFELFFLRGYLLLLNCLLLLLIFYSWQKSLERRYLQKESVFYEKLAKGKCVFFVLLIISSIIMCFFPIDILNGMVYFGGAETLFFAGCLGVYAGLNLLFVCLKRSDFEKGQYRYLVIMSLFLVGMVVLGVALDDLTIVNQGVVLVVVYLYMMVENHWITENKVLLLERDQLLSHQLEKSTFLRSLSYEIRGSINAINGFSQIILDSENVAEIREDVKDIRVASMDLVDTINGMIDLSIIESGQLQIINENYNVYEMFDNIEMLAKSKIKGKEVQFSMDIAGNIPAVLLGDSERISQIVLNLIKNSIKYTESGSIELHVSCVQSATIARLKIVVFNTGKYFEEAALEELLTSDANKEGMGLDLLVSKYLIHLMGGKFDVESILKQGTSFVVTIDQKVLEDTKLENALKKKKVVPFKASDKKILVVDDNKLNLKVARKLLEPYQVQVVEANSGDECLDIIDRDTNFDLILMDDLMPQMSGTETLDILKKIQRVDGYYIPVVVLTANAVSGMKEKYLNLGFEDYLAKPIERYELHRILKKYLKRNDK